MLFTILSAFAVSASAEYLDAFSKLSSSKPAKVFAFGVGNTIPYTNSNLSTRGTATYGASQYSYIAASDEVYLYQAGQNGNGACWAYVSYPTSEGRVYAYSPLPVISPSNCAHTQSVFSAKFSVSIRPGAAASGSYHVDKGDSVWLIATSGNNCQIMYPSGSSAHRIAGISKNTYDS